MMKNGWDDGLLKKRGDGPIPWMDAAVRVTKETSGFICVDRVELKVVQTKGLVS